MKFAVWLFMFTFFFRTIGKPTPWVPFLDDANLLIHESGHVFFSGAGELFSALGGTITQLFIPLFVVIYFAFRRELFETSFGTYWLGQNLVNVSVYVKDARTTLLPLINDGTHDWNKILSILGWLKYDAILGNIASFFGYLLMFVSIVLGAFLLFDRLKQRAAQPIL